MHPFRLHSMIVIGLLACADNSFGGPRERDVWHSLEAEGQPYGYEHTIVSKMPSGNFRYSIERLQLIDSLGHRQEISETGEYVVTPQYRPLSITVQGTQASGKYGATGSVVDGDLVVVSDRAGLSARRRLTIPPGVVPRICLDDWLGDLPAETETASLQVLHDGTWVVGEAAIARIRSLPDEWSIDFGVEGGKGTLRYDRRGILKELDFKAPKTRLRRCSADKAKTVDYVKLAGRSVLMFPLDRDISTPERLESLVVRLSWRDIALSEFVLEDRRQRVMTTSADDGLFSAVVEISPPARIRADVPFPFDSSEFETFLAETRYIIPRDADITAKANEIVAGRTTATAAVRALSEFVFKHIEPTLVAETLTGPEVLRSRKGKCSESSVLFASLARSVGIPTRIVLGERMAAGHWIGHMWNEAFVGEWIPVDAGANEVGGSCALLKLIHSDSVWGTQSLRWALTEDFGVSISDYRMAGQTTDRTVPVGEHIYTNADYACRLAAPSEEWTVQDKSKPGVVTVRFRIPGQDDVHIHFVAFGLPSAAKPKAVVDGRLGLFRASYEDFKVLTNEPFRVGDSAGHRVRFRRAGEDGEKGTIVTTEVIWRHDPYGYLANLIAEGSAHDKYRVDFMALVNRFEYLSDD